MDSLIESVEALLKFIENNDINDEGVDDGDGYVETWKSGEFSELLERTRARLNDLKRVKKIEWKDISPTEEPTSPCSTCEGAHHDVECPHNGIKCPL